MTKVLAPIPTLLVVAACAVAAPVSATTVVPLTFDELVQNAREVFIGEVVSTHSAYADTREGRAIVTLVTFRVDDALKGGLQTQTSLEFLGGTIGDVTMAIAGMPEFRVGDRDVVFVGNRSEASPVVGMMQGRFRVMRDPIRGVDTVRGYDGRAVATLADIGRPRRFSMRPVASLTLSEFRAAILTRIQAEGGAR